MTERHELAGGGWVELRDPDEVPERLRQPLKVASLTLGKYPAIRKQAELISEGIQCPPDLAEQAMSEMADGGGELAFRMAQLNILARVSAWSFGDTVTSDGLLDLPGKVYDQIESLCGSSDQLAEDLGPSPDPESPTPPSTA